jgi:ribokinase
MHGFIAIGDIVTDAFIKLKDAHEFTNHGEREICLPFATKVPYESVEEVPAVGNSSNAAVSVARLGFSTALVSDLGDDIYGKRSLEKLEKENIDTQFIAVHPGQQSNYHYVLWYGADRTILVKHQEYQRAFPALPAPKWLYLSSLGADTLAYHEEIIEYMKQHPEVRLAFQPGTFQISLSAEKLREIYARTEVFFCNVEEAGQILGVTTLGTSELLKRMQALGPKIVVITDGAKGAYAYDGTNMYEQAPYPDPQPPYDRTGAGDAFASTCTAALGLGKDLPTALQWGAINSMSVVQEVGAQKGLLTREKIEEYLKKAPPEFATKKI